MATKRSDFHKLKLDPAFKAAKKFKTMPNLPIPTAADGTDPALTAMIRKMGGDRNLAKRIMRLAEKYPVGSIPELVCMDWLMREGLSWEYQVPLMGGRNMSGGLVLDFVIFDGGAADVWSIQGTFWHDQSHKGFKDATSKWRMLGQVVRGATIRKSLELWESDILNMRPQVFMFALAGIEMGGWGGT